MSTTEADFDPQQLRREHNQCHNCHISKAQSSRETGIVTLRECSGCHVAKYCSRKCQRQHWKAHKPRCEQSQKFRQTIESFDATHQEEPGSSGPRPQDILDELGSWKKRARPFLFQAGFNAFDLVGNYLAWIDHVLAITLERRLEVDESSPHWSRFRVLKIESMHVRDFCDEMGMPSSQRKELVQQKWAMEDENIKKGAYGTIATALRMTCPKYPDLNMLNILYTAYFKDDEEDINITTNWKQEFLDSLDRMS